MEKISSVDLEFISDCLCTAFEGGSNYWCTITDFKKPSEPFTRDAHPYDHPLSKDGSLTISDREDLDEKFILNLTAIENGIKVWEKEDRDTFDRFKVLGDHDGNDADNFLQYCLFSELVYC